MILDQGRVLLARRADSGLWELPGGKQEPGESLQTCLKRELQEELGIRVRVGELLGSQNGSHASGSLTLHCFSCQIIQGKPQALEHRELAWVKLDQVQSFELCPADRALLCALPAGINRKNQISPPG